MIRVIPPLDFNLVEYDLPVGKPGASIQELVLDKLVDQHQVGSI